MTHAAAELWSLGATEAAQSIAQGRITPNALLESLLERIIRLDPQVQAWVRIAEGPARTKAAALTAEAAAGQLRGVLHGVPVGIKDIAYTAGIETNVGSKLLKGFVPDRDAEVVRRLCAAGAIMLGKTAMTEFASMDPAPTGNPWNLAHTPGGSSSGSAAAVAAYLAPAAIGTQTAGSIIRPAAYCGVVGLKPTYGAVSRDGIYPCAWSMDHVGPITRSVADAALLYAVMSGRPVTPVEDLTPTPLHQLRMGIADRYFDERIDADTRHAFAATVKLLRASGVHIVTLSLPPSFNAGVDAGIVTVYAEMAAAHRDNFPSKRDQYGWKIACLLDAGLALGAADYLRAQQIRRVAAADLSAMLTGVDCLITPSTPAPAPYGLSATGDWTHNMPFSASGHPTLTVPVALSEQGLPIGMQLVASHDGEAQLFRCGTLLEQLVQFGSSPYRNK